MLGWASPYAPQTSAAVTASAAAASRGGGTNPYRPAAATPFMTQA